MPGDSHAQKASEPTGIVCFCPRCNNKRLGNGITICPDCGGQANCNSGIIQPHRPNEKGELTTPSSPGPTIVAPNTRLRTYFDSRTQKFAQVPDLGGGMGPMPPPLPLPPLPLEENKKDKPKKKKKKKKYLDEKGKERSYYTPKEFKQCRDGNEKVELYSDEEDDYTLDRDEVTKSCLDLEIDS